MSRLSGSQFFVKPAQSVVLLCSPNMSKLGEKVRGPHPCAGRRVQPPHAPVCPDLLQVVKHTRNVLLGSITWKKFPDGFPNIFVHDVESIKGCHVVFLASFSQVSRACQCVAAAVHRVCVRARANTHTHTHTHTHSHAHTHTHERLDASSQRGEDPTLTCWFHHRPARFLSR